MSEDLKQQFEAAAKAVNNLEQRPSNEDLLALYALYKQAKNGDVTGSRPGGFDFAGGAKYDAWSELQGVSPEDAMQRYVSKVESLKG